MRGIAARWLVRVLPLVLFVALGALVAVLVRGALTGTAEADPCFGQGTLLSTRQVVLKEHIVQELQERFGWEVKAGDVREVHECQVSPWERVTFDAETGQAVNYQFDEQALKAYYEEHPEEAFLERMRREEQSAYVAPNIPEDQTAPCDANWTTTTLDAVEAVVCHPTEWAIQRKGKTAISVGSDTVSVGVYVPGYAPAAVDLRFACDTPQPILTPAGPAGVCALPVDEFGHQPFGMILPDGRKVGVNILKGASAEEKALAFQVAANVESPP